MTERSRDLQQYLIITANYWAFTLTDGALRMLVILYFHQLGYAPLQIAMLFLFYELFGVITNLLGGWLGARAGLNRTMNLGLLLQLIALGMLLVPTGWLTVVWVMAAQALSGVAKDLNKMSAKSAIKLLVPDSAQNTLYKWVAILTGSKNTLKGVGFFLGGVLLGLVGFKGAIMLMVGALSLVFLFSLFALQSDLGKSKRKPGITRLLAKNPAINRLSTARFFLFAARDVWFVVALPVYLTSQLGWNYQSVGAFMAGWIILYGLVQTQAPRFTSRGGPPGRTTALVWVVLLTLIPAGMAATATNSGFNAYSLVIGLLVFGAIFAVNSSLHSYLIVRYADADTVSMDIGFYYMSNAGGRLCGTVLSGFIYQQYGLPACLWVSSGLLLLASLSSLRLPKHAQTL